MDEWTHIAFNSHTFPLGNSSIIIIIASHTLTRHNYSFVYMAVGSDSKGSKVKV